jgi:hypothetical protein
MPLGDAVTAAQVFLVLATRIEQRGPGLPPQPPSVGRLYELSRRHSR